MSFITELVVFDASEAYQKDKSIVQSLVDVLNRTPGKIAAWHGPKVEDAGKGYLWVRWESLEHHKALIESPDYPAVIDGLKPAIAGAFELVHVNFNKDPAPAFASPVTEVVAVGLKEGKTEADLLAFLESGSNLNIPGATSPAFGPIVEKPGAYIMVVGWPSVEAHLEVRKNADEASKKVLAGVLEIADFTAAHADLKEY